MGRPDRLPPRGNKCTPEQRQEVLEAYQEYVEDVPYPLVAEFVADNDVALKYGVNRYNIADWPEMQETTDRLVARQEAYLVRGGMGARNAAMSIFLLKQPSIGYRDRVEQDVTSDGERVLFNNLLPRPIKLEKPKPKA